MIEPRRVGGLDRRSVLTLVGGLCAANLQDSRAQAASEASPHRVFAFEKPDDVTLRRSPRKVFAHWHVFPISLDDQEAAVDVYTREMTAPGGLGGRFAAFGGYLPDRPLPRPPRRTQTWQVDDMAQDIRWAQDAGVDGFIFNIVAVEPDSVHWLHLPRMLAAAEREARHFDVVVSLDASSGLQANANDDIVAAVKSVATHPNVATRSDGRLILASFSPERWTTARWSDLFARLERAGLPVSFLPIFLDPVRAADYAFADTLALSRWSGDNLLDMPDLRQRTAEAHRAGQKWAAPIWPQDCRPKDGRYWEAANSGVFRAGWACAIEGAADFAIINTWNDYSEASHIRPSEKIGFSFHDLAAYYIAWFKTGAAPPIVRDVLFYFHRIQRTEDRGTRPVAVYGQADAGRPVNDVELVAFLSAEGTLEIELAGRRTQRMASGGVSVLRARLDVGRPSFRLRRGDTTVIALDSMFPISHPAAYADLVYRGGSSIV